MLILDTDHLVEYQKGTSAESLRLKERLAQQRHPFCITIISIEEIMRGWMAAIRRLREPSDQVNAYLKLRRLFQFFAVWHVLDFDRTAAREFDRLRVAKTRVGTMDMKIASIALAHRATLLTRNRSDFERIPELAIEDWLT